VRCPVCDEEAPLELIAGTEVTVGTVAVALERRPVVACSEGHRATPREVVRAAMRAVEDTVVQARSRLLRGDACRTCGTPLTMPVRRTTRAVTVEGDADRPVLTLRFDLPSVRCVECGADQVPSRSQEDLVVSVPAVLSPPGA
jgi:hypothetical protein